MLSFEKVSNVLGDMKMEVVTTTLLEKKSSTKDVYEGTGRYEKLSDHNSQEGFR